MSTVFENASPDALGRDAGHFRHGEVHDAALVRVERTHLLIDARVA